jgi:hypothetical protein
VYNIEPHHADSAYDIVAFHFRDVLLHFSPPENLSQFPFDDIGRERCKKICDGARPYENKDNSHIAVADRCNRNGCHVKGVKDAFIFTANDLKPHCADDYHKGYDSEDVYQFSGNMFHKHEIIITWKCNKKNNQITINNS